MNSIASGSQKLRLQSRPAPSYPEPTPQPRTPWHKDLCDEILVPVGSLVAVFLISAAIILMN